MSLDIKKEFLKRNTQNTARQEDYNTPSLNQKIHTKKKKTLTGVLIKAFLLCVIIVITFLMIEASVTGNSILEAYMALSSKITDSGVNFDKRLHFMTTDESGQSSVIQFGWKSEYTKFTGEVAANNAIQNGGSTSNPDPDSSQNGGNGGGTGNSADPLSYPGMIINGMQQMGYNNYAIAGALGSFAAESGLNPDTTQNNAMDGRTNAEVRRWQGGASGRAIGFAQWDGSRAISLLDAADAAGVNWNDFDFQLSYYLAELSSQGYSPSDANSNATDVEHAAWYFTKKFERCGTCAHAPCGGGSNGAHGVGTNAAYVSFENRNHINGWNTRNSAASTFYNSYLSGGQ